MPRWRRPSLMAARKAAPVVTMDEAEAARLTFRGDAAVSVDSHHEFRRLRYRMVRLSDGPDEVRSREIGRLDRGDEVELLESYGAYWKVRIPTGQIGWIHRMTLGDSVTPSTDVGMPGGATTAAAAFGGSGAGGLGGGSAPPFGAPGTALANSSYMARLAAAAVGSSGDGGDYGGEGLAARLIRERSH